MLDSSSKFDPWASRMPQLQRPTLVCCLPLLVGGDLLLFEQEAGQRASLNILLNCLHPHTSSYLGELHSDLLYNSESFR